MTSSQTVKARSSVASSVVSGRRYAEGLRQVLIYRHKVASDEAAWYIYSRIFPVRTRLWRNLRILLGGDPFDAEFAVAVQLLNASSEADVGRVLGTYPMDTAWLGRLRGALLGCRPDPRKVLEFFAWAMAPVTKERTSTILTDTHGEYDPA